MKINLTYFDYKFLLVCHLEYICDVVFDSRHCISQLNIRMSSTEFRRRNQSVEGI